MSLTVMEDNTILSDAVVGMGTVDLRKGCATLETVLSVATNVVDKNGKITGRVTIRGSLYPAVEPSKLALPAGVQEAFVRVDKIACKNVTAGSMISAPVCSVQITYGTWSQTTMQGEGKSPVWSHADIDSPVVAAAVLSTQPLTLSLLDNKKVVATAEIPNLLLAASRFGTPTVISLELQHVSTKKPAGTVDITVLVLPPDQRKPEGGQPQKAIERTFDYTDAELRISCIHLKQLVNKEWIGKADPFVIIRFSDWMEQTSEFDNAGSEVVWNDLQMRTDTTVDELLSKQLEVLVYDKNSARKNALIGTAKFQLKRLAVSVGREIELSEELNDGRKVSGVAVVRMVVNRLDVKNRPQLPADLPNVQLHVFRISTFDLRNTEWIGKQDPFVVVKVRDWKDQSPMLANAGGDVVFEDLQLRTILPTASVNSSPMTVEVWDANNTGKRLVGSGVGSLRGLCALDEEYQIPIKLVSDDESPTGRCLLFVKLGIPPLTAEQQAELDSKIVVPADFITGWVDILRISAHGLRNTAVLGGMLGNIQDPYCQLTLADWNDKTEVKENGGTDCTWDLLDLSAPVTADVLRNGTLSLVVKHQGTAQDEVIGSGTCKVIRSAGKLETPVIVEVNLSDKKGKPAGMVELHLLLHKDERDTDYTVPTDFQYGLLTISKIEAFHLKNTEFFGKQDPFVTLSIGEVWKSKTYTKDNAGVQACWEHLPFQFDLYRDVLESTPLEISVFDENTSRPNALIGKGSTSLVKCAHFLANDATISLLLYDSKNKVSGKLKLFCKLIVPEPEADLPTDFVEGILRIKQVSAFGLQKTEFFGLSKTDPYAVVTVNSDIKKTKMLSNHGGNPNWSHLDFQFVVDNRAVRVDSIQIEVLDSNTTTADKKLGTATIAIKKFVGKLGGNMDVSGQLLNVKGQIAGDVVISGQLEPRKTVVKVDLGLPDDFSVGVVTIHSLQAKGLKNTERFGQQVSKHCILFNISHSHLVKLFVRIHLLEWK